MSLDIDKIKRKLLIKYPMFGSTMANLKFEAMKEIGTAATDGKRVLYNPEFVVTLEEKKQIFLFAHEICHVLFDHIFRSEGKDKKVWNIATDAVINALLQDDGLPLIEGGVDMPEAIKYNAEEMYEKLLKEKQEQEAQQDSQQKKQQNGQQQDSGEQQGQAESGQQDQDEQQENQGKQQNTETNEQQSNSQSQDGQQGESKDAGHDTHDLWEKAIEDKKKEEQEQQNSSKENNKEQKQKEKAIDEKESFKQNKMERKRKLQEMSQNLAKDASQSAGDGIQREGKKLEDIGIAKPLIDWRKLLRQAVKYNEEYTRKNARTRDGLFRHRVEQIPIPETEIVLDVSRLN